MSGLNQAIDQFMSAQRFAVAGASDDPEKYGHKCFAALLSRGCNVVPLNPRAKDVLGMPAYPNLAALPEKVESLSVVTPPRVTEKLLDEAVAAGVKNVWMQPGAEPEDTASLERARAAGVNLIYGGPCLLVELAVRKRK
ncbi:MAG TPA: CoA-binding protein [Planctomycetota bacterium]|nr:CoA-binding protein [Planctomycetota bacterium]